MNDHLSGVIARACNVRPAIAAASGEKLTTELVVAPSHKLWWGHTRPLRLVSEPGEGLAFSLPVTDQDGYRAYTARITTYDALGRVVDMRSLWFVLPTGDLSPVTIDALPPAPEAFASGT